MDFATWAYPWDLLDEGVETVAGTLREKGITEVNLATNYHTVQTFLPHNPNRRTYFARPSSYFQPGSGYGRLEPVPHGRMGEEDWLNEIAAGLEGTGVSLNSWTVGCLNSRLGMANPDLTFESPFGDSLVFGLCPSKPAVQQYLTTLVDDLAGRGSIQRIELESFDYMYGTGYGWHHAKFHTRLGTLGEFLFGLCFCEDCLAHAEDTGVEVQSARETARETITAIAEGDLPHDVGVGGWMNEHPTVARYAETKMETLSQLYSNLDDASGDADLGSYLGMLRVEDAWMHGIDLDALAESLDYHTVLAYVPTAAEVADRLQIAETLSSDVSIHAGLLPAHPPVTDEDTVRRQVRAAAEAGAERISFYNYGLLPRRNLVWVGAATEPYR